MGWTFCVSQSVSLEGMDVQRTEWGKEMLFFASENNKGMFSASCPSKAFSGMMIIY